MIQFAQTTNVTWDYLPIGYWSAVEAHVGAIVACLPAIRQLQRLIRERIWPKQVTTENYYYEENSGNSSKKNGSNDLKSRIWLPKTDRSQLSTLGQSRVDKEDFVRLGEFEMGVGMGDGKEGALGAGFPKRQSSERSLDRSFKGDDDLQPLEAGPLPAPALVIGSPMGGITVQSEYSVDRGSLYPGMLSALPQYHPKEETLMDMRRWI